MYYLIRGDRETLGICIQFITGYARMNRHQNLIDRFYAPNMNENVEVTPPQCRLCDKGEEAPFQLMVECEEMRMDSYRCFGSQNPNHNRWNYKFCWKAHKLIAFLANPKLNPLLGLGEPEDDENVDNNNAANNLDDDVQQTSTDAGNGNNNDNNNDIVDESQVEDTTMRDLFNGYCRGI